MNIKKQFRKYNYKKSYLNNLFFSKLFYNIKLFFILFLIFNLVNCQKLKRFLSESSYAWSYEGNNFFEKWNTSFPSCDSSKASKSQSPIDIKDQKIILVNSVLKINYINSKAYLINNGHTVEVSDSIKKSNVVYNDKIYTLAQIHFHTPSEHKLNGKIYPAEMHFVHKSNDGKLLEIGVFIEETSGKNVNEELTKIAKVMPDSNGKTSDIEELNFPKILPNILKRFEYPGSLTVPPCTEGVQWLVIEQPVSISKVDLENIKKIIKYNARPTQEIFGRQIVKSEN